MTSSSFAIILALAVCLTACSDHQSATAPPRALVFQDRSATTGLPLTGHTSGAVYVDLDGDGRRDILLGRHDRVPEAYRNDGALRFAALADWGRGMDCFDHHATLADDIDRDGILDYYFVVGAHRGQGAGSNALYFGGGDRWQDEAESLGVTDVYGRGRGAILVDPDHDGCPSLMVLNFRSAPRSFRFCGGPRVEDRVAQDLGIPAADESAVARGEDHTRDEYIMRLFPHDHGADGHVDYVAIGGGLPLKLLRGSAAGIRADIQAIPPDAYLPDPVSAVWGDFDGDLDPDLYLVYGADDQPRHIDIEPRNRLLLGGDGGFREVTPELLQQGGRGLACVAADFDNSGTLDVAILQSSLGQVRSRVLVLLNLDGRTFAPARVDGAPAAGYAGVADGLLAEDLDDDGDIDLMAIIGDMGPDEPGGGVRLLANEGSPNHWLRIALTHTRERLAYGARVTVTAGSLAQERQCWPAQVGGSSYQADLHFGLGNHDRVDSIVVHWPTGEVTSIDDIAADRVVVIDGTAGAERR